MQETFVISRRVHGIPSNKPRVRSALDPDSHCSVTPDASAAWVPWPPSRGDRALTGVSIKHHMCDAQPRTPHASEWQCWVLDLCGVARPLSCCTDLHTGGSGGSGSLTSAAALPAGFLPSSPGLLDRQTVCTRANRLLVMTRHTILHRVVSYTGALLHPEWLAA